MLIRFLLPLDGNHAAASDLNRSNLDSIDDHPKTFVNIDSHS
jgi:hypothetical protein